MNAYSGRPADGSERVLDAVEALTEKVAELAARVEGLGAPIVEPTTSLPTPEPARSGGERTTRPPLPDPRLVRLLLRNREQRSKYFDPQLFADPAWDMLLDLTAARAEHKRVSVTSLCIASGVPATTALRWIALMVEQGLFVRVGDQTDRRRAFIELSKQSADAIASYFADASPLAVG